MVLKNTTPFKIVEIICSGDHLEFNLLTIVSLTIFVALLFQPFCNDLISLSLFASTAE